jgi:hypothetical protein
MPSLHYNPHIPGEFARVILRKIGTKQFYVKPSQRSSKPPSEKTLAVRQRFSDASAYSKAIFQHPERRVRYVTLAKDAGTGLYATIMADILRNPVINVLDTDYHGVVGNPIVMLARGDLTITEVRVVLRRPDGMPIESGYAAAYGERRFQYVATQAVPVGTAIVLELSARDTDDLEFRRMENLTVA